MIVHIYGTHHSNPLDSTKYSAIIEIVNGIVANAQIHLSEIVFNGANGTTFPNFDDNGLY